MLSCALAGCGTLDGYPGSTSLSGNLPSQGPILPDTTLNLSNSIQISLEKMVFWGMYAGAAYLILDPLAPNWEIEQAAFADSHYHFSLKMKRFYAGGAGESRAGLNPRPKQNNGPGGEDGEAII